MDHIFLQKLLDDDRIDDALAAADSMLALDPSDGLALFMRGKALWRLGRRAEATCAYAEAAGILGPGSAPDIALQHAAEIENFFNPDLLNP